MTATPNHHPEQPTPQATEATRNTPAAGTDRVANHRNVDHAPASRTVKKAKPGWRTAFFGSDENGGTNASWSSIFVGVVITLATLAIFTFLGSALGFGIFDLNSSDPLSGVGTGMIIWFVVTLVIAFGLGAYVAGALAIRGGAIHGLATFATSMIALFVAVAMGLSAVFGFVGNALGGVASTLTSGASSVASVVSEQVEGVLDDAAEQVDIDQDQLAQQTRELLEGTGVEELQPEYLSNQAEEAGNEIQAAAKELVLNPEDYESILTDLGEQLGARAENIAESVDRNAIVNSVKANTDLTGDEAEQVVDNTVEAAENAANATREGIQAAQNAIPEVVNEVEQLVDDARNAADEATDTISTVSTWTFVALIIAALFAAFMGALGSRTVISRDDSGDLPLTRE